MGYVKISDPNIIDLNAMHNIINVVNQHSDTLNNLTNNYGANNPATVNYNASDLQHVFDTGSQMIIYGRATFDASSSVNTVKASSYSPAGKVYYKDVTFSDGSNGIPAFTISTPIILLTLHAGNTSDQVANFAADAVANVYNVTSTSFKIRMFMQESITGTGKVYINWAAIGPKNK